MATLFRFIKNVIIKFFKFLNFIRLFILNALFFVLLLFIFASFDSEPDAILVNENSFGIGTMLNLFEDITKNNILLILS